MRAPSLVPLSSKESFGEALGGSVAMRALFARLERAAPTVEPLVLQGESGTGKELFARAVHEASPRAQGPFVVFDCSAVLPPRVEVELLGCVAGAVPGATADCAGLLEQAHGGTLVLDQIGELPLEVQPLLRRALEMRQVKRLGGADWRPADVRIIAATQRDLRALVAAGSFREDLYYRVAAVEARIPPLRERREDIPRLVEHFLSLLVPPRALSDLPPDGLALLQGHSWPGNVRELRNTTLRLALFPDLSTREIGAMVGAGGDGGGGGLGKASTLPLREARELVLSAFERAYLQEKLREHGDNVSAAAKAMGVSRQFTHRLLARHGLRGGED